MKHFEPEAIEALCREDLAAGLRALASAIDAREVEGFFVCARAGAGGLRDARAHVVVTFRVAAELCAPERVARVLDGGCDGE